jgi:hypothetical protein
LSQLGHEERWECLASQARELAADAGGDTGTRELARAYLGWALERLNELEAAATALDGLPDSLVAAVRIKARDALAVTLARLAKGGLTQVPAAHWNTQQFERALDLLRLNRRELAAGAPVDGDALAATVDNLLGLARLAHDLAVHQRQQPRMPAPTGAEGGHHADPNGPSSPPAGEDDRETAPPGQDANPAREACPPGATEVTGDGDATVRPTPDFRAVRVECVSGGAGAGGDREAPVGPEQAAMGGGSPPPEAVASAPMCAPSAVAPGAANQKPAAPDLAGTDYLQQAEGFLAQARSVAAKNTVLLAQVAWTASRTGFLRADYPAALAHLREAQDLTSSAARLGLSGTPPRHWVSYQIAISHHHLGQTEMALNGCLEALEHLRTMPRTIAGDRARMKFLGDKYKIYSSAVHLAWRRRKNALAFACIEQSKSQTLNELLYPGTSGDADTPAAIPALEADTVRALLPADTLMISYFLGREVGEIPEGDTGVALARDLPPLAFRLGPPEPGPADCLDATRRGQKRLREDLAATKTLAGDAQSAALVGSVLRRLSTWLLAPLEQQIRLDAYRRLLFVPHRELHGIPLHGLRDATGQPLLDRYVVSYLPSAGLLRRTCRPSRPCSILLVVPDVEPPLPDAPEEARQIKALYEAAGGRARLLQGPAAHRDAVLADMPAHGVVHIVSHGGFDDRNPMASHVQLADGPLTAQDIRDQGVGWLGNTHLVVLSACTTGRQGSPSGDESQGLTRALLAVGATALVVTGWPVSDAFSRHLMVAFYRAWLAGGGLDDALRRAWKDLTACDPEPPPMPFMAIGGGWRR